MLTPCRKLLLLLQLVLLSAGTAVADYPLQPVPFNKVEMTSDFWRPRLETQRKTLVPFAFQRTQPGVEHLKAARDFLAGKKVEGHRAHRFIDSDLYKVMEGAAYLLQLRRDPELEKTLDDLAEVIAGAQHENGYLYPSHTTGVGRVKNMMGDKPYTFIVHSHELYNVGHLYEAAIAYYRATGKRKLLDTAEKSAAHISKVIFEGDPDYNGGKPIRQAPGHQEMELALVKLYRVTEQATLSRYGPEVPRNPGRDLRAPWRRRDGSHVRPAACSSDRAAGSRRTCRSRDVPVLGDGGRRHADGGAGLRQSTRPHLGKHHQHADAHHGRVLARSTESKVSDRSMSFPMRTLSMKRAPRSAMCCSTTACSCCTKMRSIWTWRKSRC